MSSFHNSSEVLSEGRISQNVEDTAGRVTATNSIGSGSGKNSRKKSVVIQGEDDADVQSIDSDEPDGGQQDDENVVEEEEEETKPAPQPHVFICHEATYVPNNAFNLKKAQRASEFRGSANPSMEFTQEQFFPIASERRKYPSMHVEEIEFRPAALSPFPMIMKQIASHTHSQLIKYGCQRVPPQKVHIRVQGKKKEVFRVAHESMEKRMNRLKIYKRALSAMVLYFRAYSPILFQIKKSYDDVLNYRLKQFKETQIEKSKIHRQKLMIDAKVMNYRFPEYEQLKKANNFAQLLLVRIQKQDEAIQFLLNILRKMEACLSEHYERNRDLEDQNHYIEEELAQVTEQHIRRLSRESESVEPESPPIPPPVAQATPPAVRRGSQGGGEPGEEEEEEEVEEEEEPREDEDEYISEEKRAVLILAYAICMKDLEESQKKLVILEKEHKARRERRRQRRAELKAAGLLVEEEDSESDQDLDKDLKEDEEEEETSEEAEDEEDEDEDESEEALGQDDQYDLNLMKEREAALKAELLSAATSWNV